MDGPNIVLTYRDYEVLPADGRRYELHDGDLCVTPAPTTVHQKVVLKLARLLADHVDAGALGEVFVSPVDVILDAGPRPDQETTVVQPDLVYVERSRLNAVAERGIEGPPTLVVEVVSRRSARIDRETKLRLYAKHRVPYYWIVDPDARSVEAYRLGPEGYVPAGRAAGPTPLNPPPFADLTQIPDALWT